jgi:GTP-binding protein Era
LETKTVFAALVGRPNVGKSSLLNYLLGERVAIVTSKPQTTRNRIVGILTKGDTQYVFIDTPGLHRPRNRLGSYMMHQTQASVSEVNLVILVTEWEKPISNVERAFCRSIAARNIPAILAINKIDLLRQKDILLEKIRLFKDLHNFDATVLISAKTGDGVARLLDETEKFCVNAPICLMMMR